MRTSTGLRRIEPANCAIAGGHRGGKQQRLPIARHLGNNTPQIGQETHIEHPISLVEHENLHRPEVDEALVHQIEQSTGGGDERIDAVLQVADLGTLIDATEDDGMPKSSMAAVGAKAVADLRGQLAGRREHEGANRSAAALRGLLGPY